MGILPLPFRRLSLQVLGNMTSVEGFFYCFLLANSKSGDD